MQIKPASAIAHSKLTKILLYGPPGSGKTPLCASIQDVLMCITEPGALSIRDFSTAVVECPTTKSIEEFFTWLKSDTKEKDRYRTICFDSISEMCSIYIRMLEGRGSKSGAQADGRKVYGDMAKCVMKELIWLYGNTQFNVVLIAKRGEVDYEGITKFRPYFPGKQLNTDVPHLFDGVYHIDKTLGKWEIIDNIPKLVPSGPGQQTSVIYTKETTSFAARDRSGALNDIEYPNMNYILWKTLN